MLDFQDKHHKKTLIHDDYCLTTHATMPAFVTRIFFLFVETASGNGSWENLKYFVRFGIPYQQADTLPLQGENVADLICFFQILC